MTAPLPQSPLAHCWAANRDRTWFFVKPGGNWGDHLIYAGAEHLARTVGLTWVDLDWETLGTQQLPRNAGIYLHGHGGFNVWGSRRAFQVLREALSVDNAVVIQGPQTCDTTNETKSLLAMTVTDRLAAEVHFFARETTTANFLEATLPPAIAIQLDHDTAFHLPERKVLSLAGLEVCPTGRYRLLASRDDAEAPLEALRNLKGAVCMDPARYADSFPHWLRIHALAKCITSNRLHSAIVGSLLQKPVTMLEGRYHKNRSVWEFSLRQRGVQWADQMGGQLAEASRRRWLPTTIANSWKVQRALMRLRGVPAK